ncbi:uncharacterized protein DS421_6g182900 [Arachis hypogaea]|nr:uncharacterized protein DS421_6g182900 [Arachis hypogaea]
MILTFCFFCVVSISLVCWQNGTNRCTRRVISINGITQSGKHYIPLKKFPNCCLH